MNTPASPKSLRLLAEKSILFVQNAELTLHNLIESHDTYQVFIEDRPDAKDNIFLSFLDAMIEFRMGLVIGVAEISSNIRNLVQSDMSYLKRYYILQINARLSDCYKYFLGIGKDKRGVWKQFKKLITKYKKGSFLSQYDRLTTNYRAFEKLLNKYERDVAEHYNSSPGYMYTIYSNANSEERVSKCVTIFLSFPTVLKQNAFVANRLLNGRLPQALRNTIEMSPHNLDHFHRLQLQCRKEMESLKEQDDNIVRDSMIMTWSAMTDLMMFIQFVRADLACALYTYIHSKSEMESALCLRRIHIIKTSALAHLYGYQDEERKDSLWHYATFVFSITKQLKNERTQIEKKLQTATSFREKDADLRALYVHYREKNENRIPELFHVVSELIPMEEFDKAISFLELCNDIQHLFSAVFDF